ncbi:hypothetical protein QJS04_geneDACA000384 [Acorus gramineus]|uniref:Sec1 family domain-containing protein 2 n=1 Tax=Acorus gramineus TaxID=55184 RepID=A0AAV9ASP7_ACOGR|nr:hypothetical protein QJS04_geneDACA000384 [Acorus gramineus]
MAATDVIRSCLDSIRQISDQVSDAILYLDAGCLEAFQFLGAFPLLLELGVRAVCSLENMTPLDVAVDWSSASENPAKKMVVITSRLLSDAHRHILRCLSAHQRFVNCFIFTSISEIDHSAHVDSPLGPDAFHEYESLLVQDYEELVKNCVQKRDSSHQLNELKKPVKGNYQEKSVSEDDNWSHLAYRKEDISKTEATGRDVGETVSINSTELRDDWSNLVVAVNHFPMILCPLSPRVFFLPSEGTIAEAILSNEQEESLSPGLPPICTGSLSDVDDPPPGATLTAHFLYHLVAKMDLKMEIFSLGDLSKTIGKILTDMSSLYDVGRRNRKSACLLLIDRPLDLLTPCLHGDSLVDRMLSSLPRRGRTASSARVKSSTRTYASLHRAPLDVQIPLERVLTKVESSVGGTRLSESMGAFLSGWNSGVLQSNGADPSEHVDKSLVESELSYLSGSFVSTDNYQGANFLEAILERNSKDGALLIKKWLLETLRRERMTLNTKVSQRTTASELNSMAKMLASNQISLFKSRGLMQLAAAAEIALSDPYSSRWDALANAEKILSISARDTSQSLSSQICDFILKSVVVGSHNQDIKADRSLISFQDALLLAIVGYILAGENFTTSGSSSPFSWDEEHSLKEAIMDVILENPVAAKFRFLHGLEEELEANSKKVEAEKAKEAVPEPSTPKDFDDHWGDWDDDDVDQNNEQAYGEVQLKLELRDKIDHLFKFFYKLSSLKRKNPSSKEGKLALESWFSNDSGAHKGLLYKLLTMVLSKLDIPGLEYHSSAVGRFFKSGFGRFGLGQAKPSLGDQDIILVFVVGGISGHEVREAQEAISESGRPDVELILGGTTLLTPNDMFDLLLGSSSYI